MCKYVRVSRLIYLSRLNDVAMHARYRLTSGVVSMELIACARNTINMMEAAFESDLLRVTEHVLFYDDISCTLHDQHTTRRCAES